MTSIVARSLRKVLDLWTPAVPVLSYVEHFEGLWRLDPDSFKAFAPDGVVCLLWDKTPYPTAEAVRIANYLSPIDWAVAMSVKHAGQTLPTRVILLDGGFEPAGSAATFFGNVLTGGYQPMPWFHLVKLTAPGAVLGIARALTTPNGEILRESAMHLRSVAVGWLTQPANAADRHALANLVGPRLLLGGFEGAGPGLVALTGLLGALDLFPSMAAGPRMGTDLAWFPPVEWRAHVDSFWLVDDLAKAGWADFVKSALQTNNEQELEVHTGPEALVDLLSKNPEMVRLGTGLPGLEWDKRVLILDLRLFAPDTGNSEDAERRMFKTLAEIAKAAHFVFPHLEEMLAGAIVRETPEYHAALALLPSLLSKADPFLPIVVFSSTRQRGVAKWLTGYSSTIILDLEKPPLDGRSRGSLLQDTRWQFRRAFRKAVAIARARSSCRVLARACAPSSARGTEAFDLQGRQREWKVVHVFLDESGDLSNNDRRRKSLVVGGLVLLLPDYTQTLRLREAMLARNLVWGLAEGFSPAPGRPEEELPISLPKQPSVDPEGKSPGQIGREEDAIYGEWLRELRETITGVGGAMFAFGLEADRDDSDTTGPDSLHRDMLAQALDLLLTGVLPHYLRADVHMWFHVATRSSPYWPLDSVTRKKLTPAEARRRFGLRPNRQDGRKFYSFNEGDGYPLARAVWLKPRKPNTWMMAAARGVRLVNFDGKEFSDRESYVRNLAKKEDGRQTMSADNYRRLVSDTLRPEQVHYAADFLTRLVRGELVGDARRHFTAGFLSSRAEAGRWLDCIEAFRRGGAEDGVYEILRADIDGGRYGDLSAGRWVRADAAAWVASLAKERPRFSRLVNRLKKI